MGGRATYGANYGRLAALKAKYDPKICFARTKMSGQQGQPMAVYRSSRSDLNSLDLVEIAQFAYELELV